MLHRVFALRYRVPCRFVSLLALIAGGRLQYGSNDGWLTLVQPGREFELIESIDFGEAMTASLAVSGGTLYVRSYEALYAIRNQ